MEFIKIYMTNLFSLLIATFHEFWNETRLIWLNFEYFFLLELLFSFYYRMVHERFIKKYSFPNEISSIKL